VDPASSAGPSIAKGDVSCGSESSRTLAVLGTLGCGECGAAEGAAVRVVLEDEG
jgi:hypothetical protein